MTSEEAAWVDDYVLPGFNEARTMKIERYLALAHFGNDWHDGQFSKGYKLLCLASRRLRHYGIDRPIDVDLVGYAEEVYNYLQENYGKKGHF